MGLLDTLAQIAQQQAGQSNPAMGDLLKDLLQGKVPDGAATSAAPPSAGAAPPAADASAPPSLNDGLADLLAKLEAGGLGDQIKSWIGTGQNAPVHPDELGSALGKNTVENMAGKAGVSHDDLLTQLAKALPGIIDSLTADGRAPGQAAAGSDAVRRVS